MSRIKFSTDSASDIPASLREELDICVLPFPIAMGEREYMDGFDFTPRAFYDMLLAAAQVPTHAQLTAFQFQEHFEAVWEQGYTDLIHVSINSKGSATCQNAIQAREEFYEDHPEARETFRIHVIDSHNYTMGYGWAVIRGARMAAEGAAVEDILTEMQDWIDHVRVVFAPLDLTYAKKSGRVSAAAAFVGETLGLKPIMTFEDGESKTLAKVRGEKNVIAGLVDRCKTERRPGTPWMLIRGNNDGQAEKLAAACAAGLEDSPEMEYEIGGVIAINAGPNLVGLVYRT